ncbi:MAG: alpha/beta hydrolase [Gammaproteobacteria bacterium]|nr:alpha/beta hydrolase [Gammaproteobacteria bacterium]
MTPHQLNYTDTGAASASPNTRPIVFVHGFSCDHSDWSAQVAHFSPQTRSIACDLPGHGETSAEPGHQSIRAMGADVANLITELDLTDAVLIGHSMGCRVVMQACLDVPNRVGALVFTDGSWIGQGDPEEKRKATVDKLRAGGFANIATGLFEQMFSEGADPVFRQRALERVLARPAEYMTELFGDLQAWDASHLEYAVSHIDVPVLAIQSTFLNTEHQRVSIGDNDTTPWLDVLRAKAKAPTISIVPDVGHFNMVEAPGSVNAILEDFLATL